MAEFKDIIEGAHKICESVSCSTCETLYPFVYKVCNSDPFFCSRREELVSMETEVLQFLKYNPTPVYPTWIDWLRDNASKPIPEDIAKKLGVEPISEKGAKI